MPLPGELIAPIHTHTDTDCFNGCLYRWTSVSQFPLDSHSALLPVLNVSFPLDSHTALLPVLNASFPLTLILHCCLS